MTSNAKYVAWLFLTLRGLFKFKMRIPHENSSKASLKEPMWLITILAGLIQITRPISLNLAIFDKNEGHFRETKWFNRNYNISLWIVDSCTIVF